MLATSRFPIAVVVFLTLVATALLGGCQPPATSPAPPKPAGLYGGTNETIILSARASVLHGLRAYEADDWDTTRRAFDEALAILHRADLPDSYKDLKLIQVGLPENYGHYDLSVIHNQVRGHSAKKGDRASHQAVVSEAPLKDLSWTRVSKSAVSFAQTQKPANLPERAFLEGEIVRLMSEFGEESYTVPPVFVESVQRFIDDYQGPRRKFFQRALNRSVKYVPIIASIFRQKKVPEDMAYMALVESGFSPIATSRARARGLWQFIRSTGRIYGLRINRWRDERLDPVKSTIAAREYFLDLVAIFGSRSFMLAMASYNAGEGKITSCLKRLDDPFEKRNFWAIRGCLKRETREYVPRVIAAAVVAKHPKRYGFTLPQAVGDVDWVIVTQRASLRSLARSARISEATLRKFNPDISPKASYTSSRVINFPLAVPKGKGAVLTASLAAAQPLRSDARVAKASSFAYRVRRGDNLWTIGKRFGVSPAKIAQWNDVRKGLIRPGQTLVMYLDGHRPRASASSRPTASSTRAEGHRLTYVVQKGNSLYDIGRYFGVPYRDIMRWNRLRNARIYPGQKLTIYAPKSPRLITYKVKSGDVLSTISRRHRVRLDYLMGYNGLSPGDPIRVGQKLKIYYFD
jgi:membrane-bound lytic murein transglycosylase D